MPEMKIRANEIEFIITMKKFKYSNCEIGRKLGVTEGAIRYRVKRHLSGKKDGRKDKASALDRYYALLKQWEEDYGDEYHRPAMKPLYECLQRDCIGWLLLVFPFIGTVVTLPFWYLLRAFGLEFLAQFGPEYNVFPAPAAPAAPSPTAPVAPAAT